MELYTTSEICKMAAKNNVTVGQFIVKNIEGVIGVLSAAQIEKSPVVLGITGRDFDSIGDIESFISYIKSAVRKVDIPVALHFDHGGKQSLVQIIKAVRLGFTGVMYDASDVKLEENISILKKIVEICHAANVSVEGAVGIVPYGYCGETVSGEYTADYHSEIVDIKESFTDPNEAGVLIRETGIDILAISVGTIHGLTNSEIKIDTERLRRVRKSSSAFLSIHGGSGTPKEEILKLIRGGVSKINIGADIYKEITTNIKNVIASNAESEMIWDFHNDLIVQNVTSKYIRLFNYFKNKK